MSFKSILFIFFSAFLFISSTFGQGVSRNATLLSHVPFDENSSDIWGYEKDGLHYAVIGNATKTSVFSLEDPKSPILRHQAFGARSIWRDIKSYKNHIYVTTDQGQDGVVIIDMTLAPDTITHTFFKPDLIFGSDTTRLRTCHNLYIDEKGFMYLAGCNINKGGVLMYDLNANPNVPDYAGIADLAYSHDAFTRGDTLYTSEIYQGVMGIYDVSDKANPKLLAGQTTSRIFTHNVWPSDDGKYAFTTDEKGGAYVDAYDISDLNNIRLVDKFRPLDRETDNVIPHNTHYYNGFLVVSWYTDGLRIVDAHRPENLIEVAHYDTWEDPLIAHNGFFGCWGAFPYTGSNLVYASDINNGLFVVDVDYKRACYLEGQITNEEGKGINNVFVEILSDQTNREYSAPSGQYRTGQALSGKFKVRISHPDYLTVTDEVTLNNAEVTILDVVMIKKELKTVSFEVKDNNDLIASNILLRTIGDERLLKTVKSNVLTVEIPESNYEIFVNSWGYLNYYAKYFDVTAKRDNSLNLTLENGYQDNFEIDLGWKVFSTPNMSGEWIRVLPRKTEMLPNQIANPGNDSDDNGIKAMITGNGMPGADFRDVDNGITTLISPPMDLSAYAQPKASYDVWFFNAGGNSPINDTMYVKISNGKDEVIIDKIYGISDGWVKVTDIDVKSFITLTDSMHLIVEASDQTGNLGHIVEAGFDNFLIKDFVSSVKDDNIQANKINLFPNPASEMLQVRLSSPKAQYGNLEYSIRNALGQRLSIGNLDFHASSIDISSLATGIYYLEIQGFSSAKFVKM
jgi:choice-of-anchor B domain-containing protein